MFKNDASKSKQSQSPICFSWMLSMYLPSLSPNVEWTVWAMIPCFFKTQQLMPLELETTTSLPSNALHIAFIVKVFPVPWKLTRYINIYILYIHTHTYIFYIYIYKLYTYIGNIYNCYFCYLNMLKDELATASQTTNFSLIWNCTTNISMTRNLHFKWSARQLTVTVLK